MIHANANFFAGIGKIIIGVYELGSILLREGTQKIPKWCGGRSFVVSRSTARDV